MLARLGQRIAAVFRASAPDPFVIAVLLTALTLGLVVAFTDVGPVEAIEAWGADDGLWAFLGFSMQMCLILVTGHALAASRPVAALLRRLADLPRTGAQAAFLVALVAAALGVVNWGLGLIGGAILARDTGRSLVRRSVCAHYPLLAASGYVGLMVWHGGLSGTAPLKVTTARELADSLGPVAPLVEPMPLTQTVLSPMNLIVTGGLVLLAPTVMALLTPKRPDDAEPADRFLTPAPGGEAERVEAGPAPIVPRILEETPIVSLLLVIMIAVWAWRFYLPGADAPSGITRLTPNSVNLTMLMLGLALHGTPRRYLAAVDEAVRGCAGIILQFPLYAGIMAMLNGSGLTARFAEALASGATETTLPVLTFLSAGAVNLFIPSGGGQWAVQGPIAVRAALDAGVEPAKIVMAVAYGDQLTNMLQPFWALPLLAVTGVRARDIVGYTALLMVLAGAWVALWLLVF
ncbi:MAG: short-chain fatty acid transporter, partial [Planctomycetota bacterium]